MVSRVSVELDVAHSLVHLGLCRELGLGVRDGSRGLLRVIREAGGAGDNLGLRLSRDRALGGPDEEVEDVGHESRIALEVAEDPAILLGKGDEALVVAQVHVAVDLRNLGHALLDDEGRGTLGEPEEGPAGILGQATLGGRIEEGRGQPLVVARLDEGAGDRGVDGNRDGLRGGRGHMISPAPVLDQGIYPGIGASPQLEPAATRMSTWETMVTAPVF